MSNLITTNRRTLAKYRNRRFAVASLLGLIIGGTVSLLAPPVHAAPSNAARTKIVRYGDLNLGTTQGQQVLDQRIRRAARHVCDMTGAVSILQRREIRRCEDAAHSQAWAIAQKRIGDYRLAVRVQQ